MVDAEFVRAYDNGLHVVAEFRWVLIKFDGEGRRIHGFVLNEKDVLERIENRKRKSMTVAGEIAALSAIRVFKNAKETNPTS